MFVEYVAVQDSENTDVKGTMHRIISVSANDIVLNGEDYDLPIYRQSRSDIKIYDYDNEKFEIFKSIYHIRLRDLVGTGKNPFVMAKEYTMDKMYGFLIYGNPKKSDRVQLAFHLEFWIGITLDELKEFFAIFGYTKMHPIMLEDDTSDYFVFARVG